MSKISFDSVMKKYPELMQTAFHKLNAYEEKQFKNSYKSASQDEKDFIDNTLKESNLHIEIKNGRFTILENPQLSNIVLSATPAIVNALPLQKSMRERISEKSKPIFKAIKEQAIQAGQFGKDVILPNAKYGAKQFISGMLYCSKAIATYASQQTPEQLGKGFLYLIAGSLILHYTLRFTGFYAGVGSIINTIYDSTLGIVFPASNVTLPSPERTITQAVTEGIDSVVVATTFLISSLGTIMVIASLGKIFLEVRAEAQRKEIGKSLHMLLDKQEQEESRDPDPLTEPAPPMRIAHQLQVQPHEHLVSTPIRNERTPQNRAPAKTPMQTIYRTPKTENRFGRDLSP